MIDNFKLANLSSKYNLGYKLSDIIPKDILKEMKIKKNMNIIINFEITGGGGTHWVCLLVRNNKAFYFDSFGAYPIDEVINFCKTNNLKLGFNNFIIQNIKSTNCGLFCLALIRYVGKSNNLYEKSNEYINLFENSTCENDKILMKYLKNCNINLN